MALLCVLQSVCLFVCLFVCLLRPHLHYPYKEDSDFVSKLLFVLPISKMVQMTRLHGALNEVKHHLVLCILVVY